MITKLIQAASQYFDRGFVVIPVKIWLDENNKKRTLFGIEWRKEKNITKDLVTELIKNQTSGYPSSKTGQPFTVNYNALGLLTGSNSNILVLDIDLGGTSGFNTLQRLDIDIPVNTPFVETQSGGRHYYFSFPKSLLDVSTTRSFGEEFHIDIRGDGGLVFIPPTEITPQNKYTWGKPLTKKLPEVPKNLIDFVLEHSHRKVVTVGDVPAPIFNNTSCDELPITKYNNDPNAFLECESLLLSAGWQRVGNSDRWTRPGKAYGSVSAIFSQQGEFAGYFRNFSGNAPNIPEGQHSLYNIMMYLKFAGDHESAKKYVADLYGFKQKEKPKEIESEYLEYLAKDNPQGIDFFDIEKVVSLAYDADSGHADIILNEFRKEFVFSSNEGKNGLWYFYRGGKWVTDHGNRAYAVASQILYETFQKTIRNILTDKDSKFNDTETIKMLSKCRTKSRQRGHVTNVVFWLSISLAIRRSTWDKQGTLINLKNGVYDLENHKLIDHKPEFYMRKQAPVVYDQNAICPNFTKFLEEVIVFPDENKNHDERTAFLIQQWLGLCLCGEIKTQHFFYFHGAGSNGKSILMKVIASMMGEKQEGDNSGYCSNASIDLVISKGDDKTTKHIMAELPGARLVICDEIPKRKKLASEVIKNLTSGAELVNAEKKYETPFSFVFTANLILYGNYMLYMDADDEAIWRRLIFIDFNNKFEGNHKTNPDDLIKKLITPSELAGIFNLAIKGLKEYQETGKLQVPENVMTGISEYRKDIDQLAIFIEERCVLGDDFYVDLIDIWNSYDNWIVRSGETKIYHGKNRFISALTKRKDFNIVKDKKSNNRNVLKGIKLRETINYNITEDQPYEFKY